MKLERVDNSRRQSSSEVTDRQTAIQRMSESGQKPTFRDVWAMSAMPPKADIYYGNRNVR